MNLESISSGGLGGIIGGILALLGFHNRLSKIETKLDSVVSLKTCETIHQNTHTQVNDMKVDIQYIRNRLDTLLTNLSRRREDSKP